MDKLNEKSEPTQVKVKVGIANRMDITIISLKKDEVYIVKVRISKLLSIGALATIACLPVLINKVFNALF